MSRPARPACCQVAAIGAGVADQQRRAHPADIDAQLQGVGGHHRGHVPSPQPALDLAALGGQVAAAVAAHPVWGAQGTLAQVAQDDLDRAARAAEDDGLDVRGQQVAGQAHALLERAPPDAQVAVDDRRVVDQEMPRPARRAILVDQRHSGASISRSASSTGWRWSPRSG